MRAAGFLTPLVSSIFAVAVSCSAIGCRPPPPGANTTKEPPAKVDKIASESGLNTIHLTVEAEQHLALKTVAAEERLMPQVRTFAGEIVLPPGASLTVSAPFGGTLKPPGKDAAIPAVGSLVMSKQPIFLLQPLVAPEREALTPAERVRLAEARNAIATARIDAEGQVQQATVQKEAAQIALDRAEKLLSDGAGTVRAVDDAQAQFQVATKTLEAAQSRKKLVESIQLDAQGNELPPLLIESPQAGILRNSLVTVDQVVTTGAPLFEITRLDVVWVRVPIYSGEVDELDTGASATVRRLADHLEESGATAPPTEAPPTANAASATVDFYYKLDNASGMLRPGERMSVQVPAKGEAKRLVVPWSAILHDIHGGTWLYEQTAPQTFVRKRVQVEFVQQDLAVLQEGPQPGAKVVTAGAVELFGTEFGFAK